MRKREIAGKAGRNSEIADPQIFDFGVAIMGLEGAVEDGVIEQAIARPGQSLECPRFQENRSGARAYLVRACAHGEGRRHGAAAARAAEHVEADIRLEERLVDADMGCATARPRRRRRSPSHCR